MLSEEDVVKQILINWGEWINAISVNNHLTTMFDLYKFDKLKTTEYEDEISEIVDKIIASIYGPIDYKDLCIKRYVMNYTDRELSLYYKTSKRTIYRRISNLHKICLKEFKIKGIC